MKKLTNAVIITFHTRTERFESNYERNKFFRSLHGWNQVVPRAEKKYSYRRKGLLDEIPHIKIADSVFMIANEHARLMEDFFGEWHDKVVCEMTQVFVEKERLLREISQKRDEIAEL